jgi:hypothetical protein
MPNLVLAAKSTVDKLNRAPSAERLVNCYAYPAPEGAKAPLIIRSVPGERYFSSVNGPFLRAMERINDKLYVVSDGGLWYVSEAGVPSYQAAVTDDPNTSIAGHREDVTIAAAGSYSVWDGDSLTQPGDGAFASVSSVAFLSQYTMLAELDGRRIEWSEIADPGTRDALHFATAEARDDKIIRILSHGPYLSVFKENSTEIWANTGLGGASAFARLGQEVIERGLKDFNLACWTPDGIFWVGNDNVARLGSTEVSPPNVNIAISTGTPTHCFYYEDRGHKLAVVRFADRPAWTCDLSMGFWHERASGTDHKPWDVVASAFAYDQWHLGDRFGRIARLGLAPYDNDIPMRRTIVSRNLFVGNEKFSVSRLELEGLFGNYDVEEIAPNWMTTDAGFPLQYEDGRYITFDEQQAVTTTKRPGRIWARFSRDGGHTFGVPKLRDVGRVGKYKATCEFRALGQFEDMVVEINQTDAVDVPLLSEAAVDVS